MKIALGIYCVCMIIYDIAVGTEIIKNRPKNWTKKNWIRAIFILLGLGLIWPVCLVVAIFKGRKK